MDICTYLHTKHNLFTEYTQGGMECVILCSVFLSTYLIVV